MATEEKTVRKEVRKIPGSKLTKETACAIIQRAFDRVPRTVLAAEYGVSLDAVNKVIRGRSWFAETLELRKELIRRVLSR